MKARLRQYYDEFQLQQRSRMMRHQSQEDVLVKQLVSDCIAKYAQELR